MKRFKNVELAKMYKVSEKSIRNWIKLSKTDKLNLELVKVDGKSYILDTETNHLILKSLSHIGKKFKNRKSLLSLNPKDEFYTLFTEEQIIDIITNLDLYREIDQKYAYFDTGAKYWDEYINRSLDEEASNTPKNTIQLFKFDQEYIFSLVKDFDYINIVDIGPGNAAPVKPLIEFFKKKNKLNKYIAFDYSSSILDIARKNLKTWFGEDFPYEEHLIDITKQNFQEILFKNTQNLPNNKTCINLLVFIGSTIENQRFYKQPLSLIKTSMGKCDILLVGQRLDTDSSKLKLSFNLKSTSSKNSDLSQLKVVLNLLNITEDLYDLERVYDTEERCRKIILTLKKDIRLNFQTSDFKKELILSNKEKILLWRHRHHTYAEVIQEFTKIGFNIVRASTSVDHEQILVIAKVKGDPN